MSRYERMQSYIPHKLFYKSPEMQSILRNGALELDEILRKIHDVRAQYFIDDATWLLPQYEKYADLEATPNTPLNIRRANVKAKYRIPENLTAIDLEETINLFLNTKTTKVSEIPNEYAFKVDLPSEAGKWVGEIHKVVEEDKPAHLEAVLSVNKKAEGSIHVGGIVSSFKRTIIRPATFNMQNTSGHTYVGGLISSWIKTTIKAR